MTTQAEVRELFDYRDGDLWWFKRPSNRVDVSKPAGCIHKINGYRVIRIGGKLQFSHRLIWLYVHGEFPEDQIDHINGERSDNRIENLRAVTDRENSRNKSKYTNNTSGTTGVSWEKQEGKWHAIIRVDGRQKHLGFFDDIDEAIAARKAAEVVWGFHENHGR